ncbi:MAG: hypothetical protein V4613_02480 [Bacteroidota bacterium]
MLGIPNFEPHFFDNTNAFIKANGEQLTTIIGATLDDYWLMWHAEDNEWYNDGPVILKIDGRQFEFTAYKLDEFSLTIDQIDLTKKLDWYGLGDQIPLVWKNKAHSEINHLVGRKITDIHIITYNFISTVVEDKIKPENTGSIHETGYMLHGIEFTFEKNTRFERSHFLQIFNALDANGIKTVEQKDDSQFQRINIVQKGLEAIK